MERKKEKLSGSSFIPALFLTFKLVSRINRF